MLSKPVVSIVATLLFILLAVSLHAQESVDVPQQLQDNVRSFYLSIDSLTALTNSIQKHTELASRQLDAIQRKMDLQPKGSRAYFLERRQYEERLSDYLIKQYAALEQMQALRLETLSKLERILERIQSHDSTSAKATREKIREHIRRNQDRQTQVRIEILQILDRLRKPDLPEAEILRLNRRLQLLQNNQLALYASNQNRFTALLASASVQNQDWPGVQNSLRTIWENLQTGFEWIEAEMTYLQLFAEHRKNWLALDAQLLEVSGLVDRFRQAVTDVNSSSALLKQMQKYEEAVYPGSASQVLPEIPSLKWPGQPENGHPARALTTTEIDSLRQVIEKQLESAE